MRRGRAVLLAFAAAGCVVEEPPPEALPDGDVAAFAEDVQPVVDRHCADPTCHGRPDRPLALYSPGRFRRDAARTYLIEPLSDEELAVNARSVAVFALDPEALADGLDGCLVLRKPLALAAGGCGHEGGEIFLTRDDRGYRALRGWLATVRIPEEAP